jgi:sulfite reductase subunit B
MNALANPYMPQMAKITKIREQTSDTKAFEFQFVDPKVRETFTYEPGQFVELSVFGIGEAPFGISSTPTRKGFIELGIRNVGNLTNFIHQMKVGDTVGMRGPYGKGFPIETMKGKDVVIVAGGTGMFPTRSLINYIVDKRKDFGHVKILCGFRSPQELLFKDEFDTWKNMPNTEFLLSVDKGDETWKGNVGVITTLFPKTTISPESYPIIVGPPVMYRFVVKELLARNIQKHRIYVSLERKMQCGIGKCSHCVIGYKYTCIHGPVFNYWDALDLQEAI